MTDQRASDGDVNRAIRSWLHEDRHEDASRVAGAVLDHVEANPHRRATWWRAWRMPFMSKFLAIGLGGAAVVAALVIGTQVLGQPAPDGVGVTASASPSPTAEPSAVSTPILLTPPPPFVGPLTESFTSTMHGISVSYPDGWTAEAAAEPWTGGPSDHSIDNSYDDRLWHPTLLDHLFLSIASQPIGDAAPEDWIAEQMAEWADVEACTVPEPIAVDGATGLIGDQGCDLAVVTTDGRGYWISLRASKDDPAAVAPFDRAWFEEVLATVRLHPEDAVDEAPPPIGGTVTFQADGAPVTTVVTAVADGPSVSGTAVTTFANGTHTTAVECATRDGDRWAFGGTTEQTTLPGERVGDWSAVVVQDGSPQRIGILLSIAKQAGEFCEAFFVTLGAFGVESPVVSGTLVPPPDLAP